MQAMLHDSPETL